MDKYTAQAATVAEATQKGLKLLGIHEEEDRKSVV